MDVLVDPRASIRNAISPYLRVLVIIGVLLAMLAVITVLATDDAEAWSTYNDPMERGAGFYTTQYSYQSSNQNYYKTYYYYYSYYNFGYNYARIGITTSGTTSYWASMTYDTGGWDDRTYIDSAIFRYYARVPSSSYSVTYDVFIVTQDLMTTDAQSSASLIRNGYYIGRQTVSSTTLTQFSITLSSGAESVIRNAIANDEQYVYFGFYRVSGTGYGYLYSFYYDYSPYTYRYAYLAVGYDSSSPYTPSMTTISPYTATSNPGVSWSAVSDRPTAPNRGYVSYTVGVFTSSSTASAPVYSYGWTYSTSTTVYGLQDGTRYYVRVKARDGSGFETGWSGYTTTVIDLSPPPVPVVKQEPIYTSGTSNVVEWSASIDGGSGTSYYILQQATNPEFTGASTMMVYTTQYTFNSLTSGTTYYYRVRAHDALGHYSPWSVPQASTQDATAPTVPLLIAEPFYTQGTENTFNWHASTDAGIGVASYRVQVADGPLFGPGDIVLDTTTGETSVDVTGLIHGMTYHARAMAVDAFGYASAWSNPVSSRQDDVGPSPPGLQDLPMYSMEGPVQLNWDGSIDSGIGTSWYLVEWSNMSDFSDDHRAQYHVLGHTFTVTAGPLINETWYFRVTPFDKLENIGTSEVVTTTIDGTAPNASVINTLPMFTAGNEVSVSWSDAIDDLSGIDHYVLHVFATAGRGLVFSDTTNATTTMTTVPGLADGATYWFRVIAVDVAGNAIASAMASTTMDASPPTVPQVGLLPQFTPGTDANLQWLPSEDAGIGGVEYMLEWALDPEFSVGAGSTDWMTGTSYEVMDLTDGQTYYFRIKARDGFGHMSTHSALVRTTMDASPPGVPAMMEMEAFMPGPMVPVMWTPVSDGSGMPVVYQVMAYDTDEGGATPVATSPWLMDTRYTFMGLDPDVEHWFVVVSKDHLAWVSDPSEAVSTTIDTTGPTAATIGEIPEFTAGSGLKVMWTAGTDDGIGSVTSRLVAYSDEALSIPVHSSEWTNVGEASVYGLADGATFWFVVESRDGFLNTGEASEDAMTTMDASAPTVTADGDLFGPDDGEVSGGYADVTSGVDTVEVSSDGETWIEATLDAGTWSVDMGEMDDGEVWVRATDMVGNTARAHVVTMVDTTAPVVSITAPSAGADVSSAVVISGSVADAHLYSYSVDYQRSGSSEWTQVQPEQITPGVNGVLATWLTAGLSGGDYVLRVTATDEVGLENTATVTVTLKGAKLSISATDISFSDTHPLPGDKVIVMVTVRNTGDSPAEDVTVTVYGDGTAIGEESGITVPAHGTYTVEVQTKAKEGGSVFTARANSPLYDTGETSSGHPLNTIEEESILENSAGIIGLLALIIGVLCLVLILMMMRGGKKDEMAPEPRDDVIVDPIMEMEVLEPEPMPGEEAQGPRTQ